MSEIRIWKLQGTLTAFFLGNKPPESYEVAEGCRTELDSPLCNLSDLTACEVSRDECSVDELTQAALTRSDWKGGNTAADPLPDKYEGVSVGEAFSLLAQDDNNTQTESCDETVCPHCGAVIRIRIVGPNGIRPSDSEQC